MGMEWPPVEQRTEPVAIPFEKLLELILDPRYVELGRVGQLIGWEVL